MGWYVRARQLATLLSLLSDGQGSIAGHETAVASA